MSDLETTLEGKKAELERLCNEYSRHLAMAHETFVDITREFESLKGYGVPGMQLVLEIMPRFNRVVKDFTDIAVNVSSPRQTQN